jgi:hypothetical protein
VVGETSFKDMGLRVPSPDLLVEALEERARYEAAKALHQLSAPSSPVKPVAELEACARYEAAVALGQLSAPSSPVKPVAEPLSPLSPLPRPPTPPPLLAQFYHDCDQLPPPAVSPPAVLVKTRVPAKVFVPTPTVPVPQTPLVSSMTIVQHQTVSPYFNRSPSAFKRPQKRRKNVQAKPLAEPVAEVQSASSAPLVQKAAFLPCTTPSCNRRLVFRKTSAEKGNDYFFCASCKQWLRDPAEVARLQHLQRPCARCSFAVVPFEYNGFFPPCSCSRNQHLAARLRKCKLCNTHDKLQKLTSWHCTRCGCCRVK